MNLIPIKEAIKDQSETGLDRIRDEGGEWLASLVAEVERKDQQLEEAQKTLEWYADGTNYLHQTFEIHIDVLREIKPIVWDGGDRAQATLKRLKGDQL